MANDEVQVTLELTPNPESLKYAVNRPLLDGSPEYFRSAAEAEGVAPLAVKLFALGDVGAVMIAPGFVSVTFTSREHLRALNQQIISTIQAHLADGQAACTPRPRMESAAVTAIAERVRQFIEEEVRPAVANDGGDVSFEGFRDGVVFLELHGACSGCPHAAMTLKVGIEARVREQIPEVQEVVAIN